MDFLKELMGDEYKEGMTKDDVQAFFKKQVLATGEYTNSGKAKAEQKQLNDKIAELQSQLEAKMTDDDKKKKADEDKEYDEFLSGISFEDNDKTEKISKYISKIVSSAYEAGKSEAIKNKLGKMGSFKEGQDGDGNGDEKGSYGKQLAQSTKTQQPEVKNFFERK